MLGLHVVIVAIDDDHSYILSVLMEIIASGSELKIRVHSCNSWLSPKAAPAAHPGLWPLAPACAASRNSWLN